MARRIFLRERACIDGMRARTAVTYAWDTRTGETVDDVIFMTGATGFIGSHFLYRALCERMPVFCLVRAKDRATGYRRLHAALEQAALAYEDNHDWRTQTAHLRVVLGDITEPECGVQPSAIAGLRDARVEFWHFAGNQCHEESARAAIFRDNVQGTGHALALATALDAVRFVQLSSAFTAGANTGHIPERLHPLDTRFQNPYEQSLCRAEHEVHAWGQKHGKDVRIARPSVVVGPKQTCLPGGGQRGFYAFMRELFRLRRSLPDSSQALVTLADANASLNLVPVDRVVDELLALRRFGFPCGPVYHLTSQTCPSLGRALNAAAKAAGLPQLRLAAERSAPASPIEQTLDQRTRFYASQLGGPKRFERRVCAGGSITTAELTRYCEGFAAELRRRNPLSLFEWRNVQTDDRVQLRSYVAGPARRPAVVLVNAYGMSAEVMVELAARLATRYRVITWRPRGLDAASGSHDGSIERQVRDLQAIMAAYELKRAHIAGWCSGADVALAFATREPTRTLSLTLLHGALVRGAASETDYQRRLRSLVVGASRSVEHAQVYHDALYGAPKLTARYSPSRDHLREHCAGLLDAVSPEFQHLASRPFLTPQSLHRYARCLQSFLSERGAAWPERPLAMPLLVVTGGADHITHADTSRVFARRMQAQLLDLPDGDHFAHWQKPEVAAAMLRLMAHPQQKARLRTALRGPVRALPAQAPVPLRALSDSSASVRN
ncbi:MAG: hypothetical protein RL701_4866 [Pseudomonadota bacterium]|jgi:nucleoside-diphosphate-sugar epimerase/pimeloyl-ACP methyl ester carboxylesterase